MKYILDSLSLYEFLFYYLDKILIFYFYYYITITLFTMINYKFICISCFYIYINFNNLCTKFKVDSQNIYINIDFQYFIITYNFRF